MEYHNTASFTIKVGAGAASAAALGLVGAYFLTYSCREKKCPNEPLSANPIKQGFSMKKIPSNLDVIVIGSGIGGLATAVILAKQGKRVLVLEQHDIAGGNLHTFQEAGYEFDTGLHYVGGKIGDKTSELGMQMGYITDGQVEWVPLVRSGGNSHVCWLV